MEPRNRFQGMDSESLFILAGRYVNYKVVVPARQDGNLVLGTLQGLQIRAQAGSGGQNDDFRPLTYTLGGRGMGCRDKYVTS